MTTAQRVPLLQVVTLLGLGLVIARAVADALYDPVVEAEAIRDAAESDAP